MNTKKLQELINRETLPSIDEICEFFEVKDKKELREMFLDNIGTLRFEFNDSYTTRIVEDLFRDNRASTLSILSEKITLATLFITNYGNFDYEILKLYMMAFGMTESAFLMDYSLRNDSRYQFFTKTYQEYKNYYFGESYEQILKGLEVFFNETVDDANKLDLESLSEELKQIKEKIQ